MAIPSPKTIDSVRGFSNIIDLNTDKASAFADPTKASGILNTLIDFLTAIVNYSIIPIAVIMFIIGGFIWLFSAGDSEKAANGQKLIGISLFGVIFITFIPQLVKIFNLSAEGPIRNIIFTPDFYAFISSIMNTLESLVAIATLVAIVYAGFQYLTSGTDDDKASKSVTAIFAAVGGMLLVGISRLTIRLLFPSPEGFNVGTFTANFNNLITSILNFALQTSAIIAIILIIYAGFNILISGGGKGTKTVVNVIVGLFIMVLSYGFVQIIFSMLN